MKMNPKTFLILVAFACFVFIVGCTNRKPADKTPVQPPQGKNYREGFVTGFDPKSNVNLPGYIKIRDNNIVEVYTRVINVSSFNDELEKAKQTKVRVFFNVDPALSENASQIELKRIEFLDPSPTNQ